MTLGRRAEEAAAAYLAAQGYIILERNRRFAQGELDIIASHRGELVFVEVRSRSSTGFGAPQETVNFKKQQKLKTLANIYIKTAGAWHKPCRFDVVGVLCSKEGEILSCELIPNAF